jgi:hypothetical protein
MKPAIPFALLLAGALLAGCTSNPPPTYVFIATDYGFDGPSEIPGGLVTLRLDNKGREPHHMTVVRLDAGKTLDDLRTALMAEQELGWMHWVAGPGPFMSNEHGAVTTTLEPGNYVLLCFVPDAEGHPHFALGMMKELTVKGTGPGGDLPEPDLTITLDDFHFKLSGQPKAGAQTVRIVKNGAQPHEAVLAKLDDGATPMDFIQAFGPNATGPPPGTFPPGGISQMDPGQTATVEWDLAPGRYVLICFVADPGSHAPHFALGMLHEFTV